ncbi:MAG: nitroreductase family protein [Planctomycetes bacterium]|jgi:nitroreductase|nr:nitroreductase family protein [Planctomycetota bacterium]HNZ67351.1 nitroreductase family protein [Planctomycetota bacterium]HPY75305.1 nitroreductase family protein [Planctomycetota bacterium]HQB00919.1 nitroreductase family protein [Planctomycetota bacterium]
MKQFFILLLLCISLSLMAQDIELPKPKKEGGMPLMQAFTERMTNRVYQSTELSLEELSQLVWVANGINRPDGKRTIPTARNRQEVEILVLLSSGSYLYNPQKHILIQKTKEDLRSYAGAFSAPVYFVLVSDTAKCGTEPRSISFARLDIGYASYAIYLACASLDLGTCAIGMIKDPQKIHESMKLPDSYIIQLSHSIGKIKK